MEKQDRAVLPTAQMAGQVQKFHRSMPGYEPTPLVSLSGLAARLGVGGIYVKDESARFGLNAFKVLGGSYAIGRFMAQRLDLGEEDLTFDYLRSQPVRDRLGPITFVTATDGNHGRGVAWMAQQIGQSAVVYLPHGAAEHRVRAIEHTGARAVVTTVNYDETVRLARQAAAKNGWQIIQDTAWTGYEQIPDWIMQGYATIGAEIDQQLEESRRPKPTHLLLQAGVGSFAASLAGYFVGRYGASYPTTVVMEPDQAACFYRSASIGDGRPHAVGGDLATIMAGLSCGEPNPAAWDILRVFADAFISCPDYVAAEGVRMLANPLGGDQPIVAGESGAVGLGLLYVLTAFKQCAGLKRKLGLNDQSVVLLISTEGDTDPDSYRRIVWDGADPLPAKEGPR